MGNRINSAVNSLAPYATVFGAAVALIAPVVFMLTTLWDLESRASRVETELATQATLQKARFTTNRAVIFNSSGAINHSDSLKVQDVVVGYGTEFTKPPIVYASISQFDIKKNENANGDTLVKVDVEPTPGLKKAKIKVYYSKHLTGGCWVNVLVLPR